MIGRLAGRLSSHWLASTFAAAYLLLSIVLGVSLLTAPEYPTGAAAPVASTPTYIYQESPAEVPQPTPNKDDSGALTATTTPPPTTTTPPSTTTTPGAPAGYQRVSGPGGLRTVIPVGWPAARTTGPGAMQATDPSNSGRYVKYGGSVAPDLGIDTSHIQYENGFAVRAVDYKRIKLSSATYGGHDAVEWEFEHRDGGALLHISSLYWRVDGKEYFVLAAAPAAKWPTMKSIYDTMVANATP